MLELVHPASYVDSIAALCAAGGGAIDADTYAVPGTYGAALRAAGALWPWSTRCWAATAAVGVSALRPPGHHAEAARAMGFCFFGNAAVAARRATSAHGLSRVMIVDWDVHHGNGTNDIFHARLPTSCSSRSTSRRCIRGPGLRPTSGRARARGSRSTCRCRAGRAISSYRSLVEHVACSLIRAWEPELVLISAGFDAHRDDPLATCRVTEAGFAGMAASLRRAADDVGAPLGLVLEGGYDLGALSRSMAALMPVLVDCVDARSRRSSRRTRWPRARSARLAAVVAGLA